MISQCLKIDLGSFWTHLESCGNFLGAFFKNYVKNVPKMTPKLVVFGYLPCRWKKMVITIGFLMVWNPCDSEAFLSGGVFDDENFGLKTKKNNRRRTPQNCPKGPPGRKLEESASHQIQHQPTLNLHWLMGAEWNCAAAQVQRSKIEILVVEFDRFK